jgi:hypothetical protein
MTEKIVEYPKHLYLNGDRNAADRVVKDKDEEDAARADGFKMIGEDEKPAPKSKKASKRPCRPRTT